jgi:DNA modification methylase
MPKKHANDLNGSDWARFSISVWGDIRKNSEESRLGHPALFPEMLVNRIIRCLTTQEELRILDPFMGSGSTLLAARNLGRYGIGFELSDDYIALAERRLGQQNLFNATQYEIHHADAREVARVLPEGSVDLCITSPPYWDILLQNRTADYKEIRHYGDAQDDLGKIQDYDAFLDALADVFRGVLTVLTPGKYCVVNVMDLRKKDRFYPLHADLARRMEGIGYIWDDLIIWDRRQDYNNLRTLGYPYVFRLNKIHEFVLVFRKPA